jgi:hypothetical protein
MMASSASSSASSGHPHQGLRCPCGLPYEDVRDACKANQFICNAPWADRSGAICGKPLGAHPRERDLNPPPAPVPPAGQSPMIFVDCRVLFHRNIVYCVLYYGAELLGEFEKMSVRLKAEVAQEIYAAVRPIKDAVVPDVIYRTGSKVQSEDYSETFAFDCTQLDISRDNALLSGWRPAEFDSFKQAVKVEIIKRLPALIQFANEKDELEVSSLQPVLKGLLEVIIPLAFGHIPNCMVEVGRFDYSDARIKTTKGKLFSFNGTTDLSCLVQPSNVPVCGFENKISKKTLILKKQAIEVANADGRKAVSQTACQILGSLSCFHNLNCTVPAFTQIGTNGWQYLLVRRAVKLGTRKQFVTSTPVSLGVETPVEGGKFCVVPKDVDDISLDIVAHMIGLMVDNGRFLAMKLLRESALTVPIERLIFDERYEDDDVDNDEESIGGSTLPLPPPRANNSSSSSSSRSSAAGAGRGSNKTKGSQPTSSTKNTGRGAMREINANATYLIPTASAIRYNNSIF